MTIITMKVFKQLHGFCIFGCFRAAATNQNLAFNPVQNLKKPIHFTPIFIKTEVNIYEISVKSPKARAKYVVINKVTNKSLGNHVFFKWQRKSFNIKA